MQKTRTFAAVMAVLFSLATSHGMAGDLGIANLRCENLADPLGIDVLQPRLSWMLQSAERGQKQTAYQIQVARSQAQLDQEKPDLWDSGKVTSGQSIHVAYAGKPLQSQDRCYWRVRVWDAAGEMSPWSETAVWSMGLLRPEDWKAAWIGRDETTAEASSNLLRGSEWIWHGQPAPGKNYPAEKRWFRKTFTLPEGRNSARATCGFAADNSCVVWLNGVKVGEGRSFKSAAPVDIAAELRKGRNTLAVEADNVGDQPNPAGLLGSLVVQFDEGEPLRIPTDPTWKTSDRPRGDWQKPDFDDSAWSSAVMLGPVGAAPWGEVTVARASQPLPARMLRRQFGLDKPVRRATVYISGLGYYELYLNGRKVGDHVLDSVLNDYDKRVPYVTYDIIEQLRQGDNAVGVILGNGRYYAPRQDVPTATRTFGYPKLRLQMVLEFDDGTRQEILGDTAWKLTTDGPIRENNDYDGEVYDGRKELPGWSEPGFDDRSWQPAAEVAAPSGQMSSPMMPPMRVTKTLEPVALSSPKPGVWIYDMGQNMVGWCRLKVRGPRGTQVTLRHAETLDKDGLLYTANLRSAKCRDIYTLKGDGPETYEPRFTYHGFRYVELSGYPGTPDLSTIEGRVVHTDLPITGQFACSNPLLTQIHHNIHWGVRGNYLSIPTDCPQRDERQGWQGDRAAESKGETFLFDNLTLYRKWLVDIEDSQRDDGNLSDVCPAYWPLYSPNVTWPSAFTIVPESLYVQFADRRPIERHYEAMKRWMGFLAQFIHDGIIDKDNYGDWCVPPEEPSLIHSKDPARKTSKPVLATCYYLHNLELLARYATMLGRDGEAGEFAQRADRMKQAFNQKFFDAQKGLYDNGTQTSCVLPIAFGIVPQQSQAKLFGNLVENITVKTDNHIGTGLIGGQWLMRCLSDHGRADLAYRLASNRTYPSWGYMIDQGATTVWELWNGNTADPAMNSGNHVMLVGDLAIWMYEYLAGIKSDPDSPGFKHIVMNPHPVGDLTSVQAEYRSIHGPIRSQWRLENGTFKWTVAIPANTTATVFVPAKDPQGVTESGKPAGEAQGVKWLRVEPGRAVYQIQSGQYEFVSPGMDR